MGVPGKPAPIARTSTLINHEAMCSARRRSFGRISRRRQSLAYATPHVSSGSLFFCVRGFTRDGHEFAQEAIAKGAVALVVDHPLNLGVPEVVVDNVRAAWPPPQPTSTTTRRKTCRSSGSPGRTARRRPPSSSRDLLEADHRQTGLLVTVKSIIGGETHEVVRTTPEAIDLQRTFREMLDKNDVAAVMEVSSHALELHRADAIHFAAAIFTNLTQDHLDFHPTMEDYFNAKRKLFMELTRSARSSTSTTPTATDWRKSSDPTPSPSRSTTPTRPTARRTST